MTTLRKAAQDVVDALIKNPTRVSKEVHIASVVLREVLAQPEREWQGLTFDDWPLPQYEYSADFQIGAQWAEARLKAKNAC